MTADELESRLTDILVSRNWDLPRQEFSAKELLSRRKPVNFTGPNRPVREDIKAEGHRLRGSKKLEDRIVGVGLIAYAHYYRSLEDRLRVGDDHPGFRVYFAHWLHADSQVVDRQARSVLTQEYPAPALPRIKAGFSYWN